MTYVFVVWHNKSYDQFLTKYFSHGGLRFDSETSFQDAKKIVAESRKVEPSRELKLFTDYVKDWRFHIESRPSLYYFLARIFDDGNLTLARLEELESELSRGSGDLILSLSDAALELSNFYSRSFVVPLREDIIDKARLLRLLDYFSPDDSKDLPYGLEVSRYECSEAIRSIATKLLSMSSKFNRDRIGLEITSVLEQHSADTMHMKPIGKTRPDGSRTEYCEHDSESVTLVGRREPGVQSARLLLKPSRGFGVIEDGWKEVMFPRFNVFQTNGIDKRAIIVNG